MFFIALFTTAKMRKQLKCTSRDDWIKMSYMYNGILLSHKKKSEIMPSVATWIDLDIIILSKSDREI